MLAACVAAIAMAPAPAPDIKALKKRLDTLCQRFEGRAGYSLSLLNSGETISFRGNERFPTASTIKTAIAIEAIRQVEAGERKWTDKMPIPPTPDRKEWEASMWTYFMKDGVSLSLDGWVYLMIAVSDNLATRVVREWVGVEKINQTLVGMGLKDTLQLSSWPVTAKRERRLNSQFGMGMTTPNEMNRLLQSLYYGAQGQGKGPLGQAGSEKLLRIMAMQYWDDFAGTSAPLDVRVASKSGAISRSRSDTAVVFSPTEPYVLTMYTDSQKDQRWVDDNSGNVLLSTMAGLVWNALHPKRPYQVPANYKRFAPTGGGLEVD